LLFIKQSAVNINTKPVSLAKYWKYRYPLGVQSLRIPPQIRPIVWLAILLGLSACEREAYTTWSCNSPSEPKISMVLRKAQMEFKGEVLDYCGSLGTQSYFDEKCSGQTNQSKTVFSPSSGLLLINGQEFQCTAL
jgi:hypothetical protein